ncbi:hypothetical protein [Streptomyces anulatus]|uniref:hypothetical protein n=1 Tax=Streptomyces anulatus TaxID=1892 RepID=UPI00365AD31E
MGANDHDSEIIATLMLITCRTPGCPEDGATSTARMYPNASAPIWAASCAGCNQMISDIVPAA